MCCWSANARRGSAKASIRGSRCTAIRRPKVWPRPMGLPIYRLRGAGAPFVTWVYQHVRSRSSGRAWMGRGRRTRPRPPTRPRRVTRLAARPSGRYPASGSRAPRVIRWTLVRCQTSSHSLLGSLPAFSDGTDPSQAGAPIHLKRISERRTDGCLPPSRCPVVPWRRRIKLRELGSHAPVTQVTAVRDFKAKYKQSALGPAWLVAQPLALLGPLALAFNFVLIHKTLCARLAFPVSSLLANWPALGLTVGAALRPTPTGPTRSSRSSTVAFADGCLAEIRRLRDEGRTVMSLRHAIF